MKNAFHPSVPPSLTTDRRQWSQSKMAWIGIGLATLFAAMLRFYGLDAESLWIDELTQVEVYRLPLSYIIPAAANTTQPPLDYWIGGGLDRLGVAGSDWWVRFPAAVFGIGGVALVGYWVFRLSGALAGITASALLAVCPLHLAMSQEARPYTIFVFLALASLALFDAAWRRNQLLWWFAFGTVYLWFLLCRWIEPHFVTLGLGLYLGWYVLKSRRRAPLWPARRNLAEPTESRAGLGIPPDVRIRLHSALITGIVVYAIYNPIFGIILDRNRRAVAPQQGAWLERFGSNLFEAATAIVCGYSGRTLKAVDGPEWVVLLVGLLGITGLLILAWQWLGRRSELPGMFLLTMATFPVSFGLTYARLTGTPAKPQYLLLLAVPLLAGVAIGASELHRVVLSAGRRAAWFSFVTVVSVAGVPMLVGSVESLVQIEKCDWRGAMTYLRKHARAGDAFASVGSDTLPPTYRALTPKIRRYFEPDSRFFWVDADASLEPLASPPWTAAGTRVWIVGYNDRMYAGYDLLPTPPDSEQIRVHSFNGLFVMEVQGPKTAAEKLVDALAYLGDKLPEHSSFVGPYIVRSRYLALRGDHQGAAESFELARLQCRDSQELGVLDRDYLPAVGELASGTR